MFASLLFAQFALINLPSLICKLYRHYCDAKGWLQPTIKALGADGLPSAPTESLSAVLPTVDTSIVETEIEVENEEEELLSSGEVVLSSALD